MKIKMNLSSVKWKDGIAIFILILAGIKLMHHIDLYMDILFADEAQYLFFGLGLPHTIVKWWGPLYAAWYKLLSLFEQDTIALYYLNYKILIISGGISMYFLLRNFKCNYTISFLSALFFLQSSIWIETWPRISHFCILLLLISISFIQKLKNDYQRFSCYAFSLFMLAYARPEFYITFWLFVFMYAANKIYKKEWSFFYNKSLLIAIAVLLIINYAVFPPNFSYKGEDRLYMAFKQHFIYNYIQIYDVKANSLWVAKDAIYKQFFGNCKSLNCIISEHPIYYCKHIFLNLILYIKLILFYFLDMISPKILHYKKLHLLISFIFLGICSIAIMKQKNEILLKVKNVIKDNTLLILFSILICATFSVSSLIIFPRQHYLFYFLIFIFILFSILISNLAKNSSTFYCNILIIICITLTLFNSNRTYHFQHEYSTVTNTPNKNMLQFIRNKLPNNYHVFYSVYDAVLAFLPNNFVTEISTENNPSIKSISNFIEENKIDVIYITPIMLKNSVFLSNPIVEKEWNLFLVNPNTLGFTKTIIENSDAYLLTKNIK